MDLKLRLHKIYSRFFELWKHSIFKYAVIIHIVFFICSIVLFALDVNIIGFKLGEDFQVYYKVGEMFVTNTNNLYNQVNYNFPFRYFPLCALFFIPFSLLPFKVAFIIFNFLNLFFNIIACMILYKIIILVRNKDHAKNDRRIITFISLFLIGFPQGSNYILGQINIYIVILVLISLYLFLRYEDLKWQLIGSVLLGISINIKPITVFLIPFLIVINYNLKERRLTYDIKKSVIRIIGIIIPVSFNLILFLIYPSLLEGFIDTNLTGSDPTILNFSFSITKLLTNFLSFYKIPFNQIIIFTVVLCIIGGFGFLIYFFRKKTQYYIIYAYILGIVIMLLVYFDSWDHHLLIITPLLIIAIFNLPKNSNIAKKIIIPSFFGLNFLNLIFVFVYSLTASFFPYNFVSTIFLVLIMFGIGKYFFTTKNNTQDIREKMEKLESKKKKVQDHFDSIASHYSEELPIYFQEYLLKRKMEFITKYCKNLDNKIGLDIGCGQGKYLNYLNQRAKKMVGIDFSFNNVKNTILNNDFNEHALNSDGTHLPFKSDHFDFCFCINVIHHLPSEKLQRNFLNEMIRVVKKNGRIFIFDLSLKNPIFSIYLKYIFPRIRAIDEGDELFFGEKKIIELTKVHTELIGIEFYSFVPDVIPKSILGILIKIENIIEKTWLKRLAMHKVIILRKK